MQQRTLANRLAAFATLLHDAVHAETEDLSEIGRASCRERVS
jgi:hypothetical protein